MKKTFRILGIALVATGLLFAGCSKNEEEDEEEEGVQLPKKVVLIEEFTGNQCGNCPDGHKRANEVKAAFGDQCLIINYHVKTNNNRLSDAYTTTEGTTLNNNFNVENGSFGIPAATINRMDFGSKGKISVNRSDYMTYATQVAAEKACAKVSATAVINRSARQLTVNVKAEYLADGVGTTNKLNVALIQNGVMGIQSGMQANPAQVVGGQYQHNEMFRAFLTGQWGEAISPVTAGSKIEKSYTYTIPESYTCISDGNASEPAVLDNMEVIVFITEANTNVVNACKATMTLQ